MTSPFTNLPDDQLLGLCLDREARGEPTAGRIAVGSVVLNRVKFGLEHKAYGRIYGNSITSVILAPSQFSWTIKNKLDPNYLGALEIAHDFKAALKSKEFGQWLFPCWGIAQGLISGEIKPNTSALYYHEKSIHPAWAKGKAPMAVFGNHFFYA
jgi:spore germination cell wall hydrolase CwlJ-like protein